MTTADQVVDRMRTARRHFSMRSARSQQSAEGRIGASDLGHCRAYLKFMLRANPADVREIDDDKLEAFIGSAYGDRIEEAYKQEHPDALTQISFDATFPSGRVVPCNADIIDPELNVLIDGKTKAGLTMVRAAKDASRQHRYQVGTYLLGAIQNGYLKEGAQAFLVYADRSGKDQEDYAIEVVVDDNLIAEIDDFVDDAIYAFTNDVEAPRDQEYNFCETYCQFFNACRGTDTLATGVIESEEAKLALKVYLEAKDTFSGAEKRKKDATEILKKYDGVILGDEGPYEVSQTIIGASSFQVNRGESVRLNVRPKREKK